MLSESETNVSLAATEQLTAHCTALTAAERNLLLARLHAAQMARDKARAEAARLAAGLCHDAQSPAGASAAQATVTGALLVTERIAKALIVAATWATEVGKMLAAIDNTSTLLDVLPDHQ